MANFKSSAPWKDKNKRRKAQVGLVKLVFLIYRGRNSNFHALLIEEQRCIYSLSWKQGKLKKYNDYSFKLENHENPAGLCATFAYDCRMRL